MKVAVNCKVKNPEPLDVDSTISINHPRVVEVANRLAHKLIIGDKEYDGSNEVVIDAEELGDLLEIPTATDETVGGILTGYPVSKDNNNTPVMLDENGRAYVVLDLDASKLTQSPDDFITIAGGDAFRDVAGRGSKGLYFISNDDGTCSLAGIGTCTDTDVVIPKVSTTFDIVTSISKRAFYNCKNLINVTIPETIVSIGDEAFKDCINLTNITIPNTVKSIGSSIFNGCSSLESLTIPFVGNRPGVMSSDINQYPFGYIFGSDYYEGGVATKQWYYGSNVLDSINTTFYIPESLKNVTVTGGNILYGAFYGCTNLTNIVLPDTLTAIGYQAFHNCKSLSNLIIPNTVTNIADNAFRDCTGLIDVVMSKNLVSIGSDSFSCCVNLTSVTLPDTLRTIDREAFYNCSALTSITFKGTVDQWNSIAKNASWNINVPATQVICTNGTVMI